MKTTRSDKEKISEALFASQVAFEEDATSIAIPINKVDYSAFHPSGKFGRCTVEYGDTMWRDFKKSFRRSLTKLMLAIEGSYRYGHIRGFCRAIKTPLCVFVGFLIGTGTFKYLIKPVLWYYENN
jgi:hypothetical protein